MASILPTTTTVPQGLHLPPPTTSEVGESFQLPDLAELSGRLREFIEERLSCGGGKKDEVWEGVYRMSPDPTNSHQRIILRLCNAFDAALDQSQAIVQPGGNVSNRNKQWYKNYCCPDVIVILPGNSIQDRKTHYFGGPDFVVVVLSEGDDSVEKLPFYAKVGTREVLHVDPETKELTLFALRDGSMQPAGTSSIAAPNLVTSSALPVSFQVTGDSTKPILRMQHTTKPDARWEI